MSPRGLFQKKLKVSAKSAARSARQTLDQVLLGFQHPAIRRLKQTPIAPSDLIQRVGQGVLQRASEIRASLVESVDAPSKFSKFAPTWLKDREGASKFALPFEGREVDINALKNKRADSKRPTVKTAQALAAKARVKKDPTAKSKKTRTLKKRTSKK